MGSFEFYLLKKMCRSEISICRFKNAKIWFLICLMKVGRQYCSQMTVMAVAAMVTLAYALNTVAAYEYIADDLAGDYCANVGCCAERQDDVCSAPILGTRCYCDDFCYLNRTGSDDCCPDFMSVCKGVESLPPEPLKKDKREWFLS